MCIVAYGGRFSPTFLLFPVCLCALFVQPTLHAGSELYHQSIRAVKFTLLTASLQDLWSHVFFVLIHKCTIYVDSRHIRQSHKVTVSFWPCLPHCILWNLVSAMHSNVYWNCCRHSKIIQTNINDRSFHFYPFCLFSNKQFFTFILLLYSYSALLSFFKHILKSMQPCIELHILYEPTSSHSLFVTCGQSVRTNYCIKYEQQQQMGLIK